VGFVSLLRLDSKVHTWHSRKLFRSTKWAISRDIDGHDRPYVIAEFGDGAGIGIVVLRGVNLPVPFRFSAIIVIIPKRRCRAVPSTFLSQGTVARLALRRS
jgi:hypothetical protein